MSNTTEFQSKLYFQLNIIPSNQHFSIHLASFVIFVINVEHSTQTIKYKCKQSTHTVQYD